MSLSEDLANLPAAGRAANECSVCHTFREAPAADRDAVNNALQAGAVATRVAVALRRNGYDVSADALRRHLKNGHTL